jgi:beta-galactosidase
MATDSRLASEFDVTHLVRPGRRHTLALVVLKWSAATWLEDQDQWWHGGLQRGVALYSTAPSHLMATKLVPGLAEMPSGPLPAGRPVTGTLDCELTFDGPLRAEPGWTAEVRVETLRGRQVATTGRLDVPVWDDSSELSAMLHGMLIAPGVVGTRLLVEGVAPWSAEDPRQYRALVTLRDPSGAVVEVDAVKVGFRSVEVRDRQLLVNGAPVVIRGANVHEHDPDRGRAVGRDLARRDLEMVKAANLNAVRGAHYPHDEQFAELCDELGLYLVDEADVETHARQWSLCHDPRFGGAIVERVERMARRDVHHPSVILWSLGNESGYGRPTTRPRPSCADGTRVGPCTTRARSCTTCTPTAR